jgi:hypothetical protein
MNLQNTAFHTSVNYQKLAPLPYTLDVHNDIYADLAEIERTNFPSEYEQHIALSRAFKKSQDGRFIATTISYTPLTTIQQVTSATSTTATTPPS